MTYSVVSLGLALLPVALIAGVLVVVAAYVAGNVFQVWGTTSTREWIFEALLRVFTGTLRQRLMRRVKDQFSVGVHRSRQTHPYLAVSVSPSDVTTLTSPAEAFRAWLPTRRRATFAMRERRDGSLTVRPR